MYTQSFNVQDTPGAKPVASVPSKEDPALQAAFDTRIDADGRIEPQDWMPDAYRKTLVRQISTCSSPYFLAVSPSYPKVRSEK